MDDPVGDLDRVREGEARPRVDHPSLERGGERQDLERGARLEGIRDGAVALPVARHVGKPVRVEARNDAHREHAAGLGVEDDRGRRFRVPLRPRGLEYLLDLALERVVDRQVDVAAVHRLLLVDHVERVAERIADDGLRSVAAPELLVERQLEARESLVVETRVADHLGRDVPERVVAPFLGIGADAEDLLLGEPLREGRVCLAGEVDEAERPVGQALDQRLGLDLERAAAAIATARGSRICCGFAYTVMARSPIAISTPLRS